MATSAFAVLFDGEHHAVKVRFRHWLPRLLKKGGLAIGSTVYVSAHVGMLHPLVLGHELLHVLDFVRLRKRVVGQWYWLAVVVDLWRYFWEWVTSGFSYRNMPEERWAYAEAKQVAEQQHPAVSVGLWDLLPIAHWAMDSDT